MSGWVPQAGTYALEARHGAARVLRVKLALGAGGFSRSLTVPAVIVPGRYRVVLVPTDSAVVQAVRDATLGAPREGVVDVARASRARFGKAVRAVRASPVVWASFHFSALPTGRVTLNWYAVTAGGRVRLQAASRRAARWVRGDLRLNGRRGRLVAVLMSRGKVIAEQAVTAA